MEIIFSKKAEKQLKKWLKTDKKQYNKIINLIESIIENPFDGIGKPEPLKENLSGYWSRRINLEDRLVYKVEKNQLVIIQCKKHY